MKEGQEQLKGYLRGTLKELTKLSEQIRSTRDYSEQAELILCLQELVSEQMEVLPEGVRDENSCPTAHAVR